MVSRPHDVAGQNSLKRRLSGGGGLKTWLIVEFVVPMSHLWMTQKLAITSLKTQVCDVGNRNHLKNELSEHNTSEIIILKCQCQHESDYV